MNQFKVIIDLEVLQAPIVYLEGTTVVSSVSNKIQVLASRTVNQNAVHEVMNCVLNLNIALAM